MREEEEVTLVTRVRVLALVGLGLCAALLAETLTAGAVCGDGGGCNEILHSAWARPLGIPLPAAGLGFFAAMLALSLGQGRGTARLFRWWALFGGVIGAGLLIVQAVVFGRFCPLCLLTDVVAVWAAVLASRCGGAEPGSGRWLAGGLLSSIAGVAAWGVVWLIAGPGRPPPEVLALRHPTRVTIVEIADFRCRHCQFMHLVLDRLEAELGDRVHRVCIIVPTGDRPESRAVGLALLCARRQGRDRAMIDELFRHGNQDAGLCLRVAHELGLPKPAFEACLTEPEVEEDLERELAWTRAATARGLPAVWVGDRLMTGARGLAALREAVLRAE